MITLTTPIHFSRPLIIPTELQFQIVDDAAAQQVFCQFPFTTKPLILWQGAAYAAVGNWTQEQAESRILELLGDDPKQTFAKILTHE